MKKGEHTTCLIIYIECKLRNEFQVQRTARCEQASITRARESQGRAKHVSSKMRRLRYNRSNDLVWRTGVGTCGRAETVGGTAIYGPGNDISRGRRMGLVNGRVNCFARCAGCVTHPLSLHYSPISRQLIRPSFSLLYTSPPRPCPWRALSLPMAPPLAPTTRRTRS